METPTPGPRADTLLTAEAQAAKERSKRRIGRPLGHPRQLLHNLSGFGDVCNTQGEY